MVRRRVKDHSLALFDVALYATLPLGGSDAQRLGRANRLESWHDACLSCTLPARFTRDPPRGRVSFVGRVRLTNTVRENEIPIVSATSKLARRAGIWLLQPKRQMVFEWLSKHWLPRL